MRWTSTSAMRLDTASHFRPAAPLTLYWGVYMIPRHVKSAQHYLVIFPGLFSPYNSAICPSPLHYHHTCISFSGAPVHLNNIKANKRLRGARSGGLHRSCRVSLLPICFIRAFRAAISQSGKQKSRTVIRTAERVWLNENTDLKENTDNSQSKLSSNHVCLSSLSSLFLFVLNWCWFALLKRPAVTSVALQILHRWCVAPGNDVGPPLGPVWRGGHWSGSGTHRQHRPAPRAAQRRAPHTTRAQAGHPHRPSLRWETATSLWKRSSDPAGWAAAVRGGVR